MSAFLQTKLEYRRPTPLILVKAYMTFCFPSTLVLRRRRMNWKLLLSPVTNDMLGSLLEQEAASISLGCFRSDKFEVEISGLKFWCGGFYRFA